MGFTGTLKVLRRAMGHFQDASSEQIPFFYQANDIILDVKIPLRQGRSNPRIIKKPRCKFSSKKPMHRGTGIKSSPLIFSILNTA